MLSGFHVRQRMATGVMATERLAERCKMVMNKVKRALVRLGSNPIAGGRSPP
jgi:transcription initiation factor IIE alpha subunit